MISCTKCKLLIWVTAGTFEWKPNTLCLRICMFTWNIHVSLTVVSKVLEIFYFQHSRIKIVSICGHLIFYIYQYKYYTFFKNITCCMLKKHYFIFHQGSLLLPGLVGFISRFKMITKLNTGYAISKDQNT